MLFSKFYCDPIQKQTKKCLIQSKIKEKCVSLSVQETNKRPKLFYTGWPLQVCFVLRSVQLLEFYS